MAAPFIGINLDMPRPLDAAAQDILEFGARSGLSDVLGLGALANELRPAPNTKVRTSHAYSLRSARGRTIGALQTMSVNQGRNVEVRRHIDRRAHGRPMKLIPQHLTTHTVRVDRLDLWRSRLEEVFGDGAWTMLTDQWSGLQFRDYWNAPNGVILARPTVFNYSGAYFLDLGRELSSNGDRMSRANATLMWTTYDQVQ